MLVSVEYVKLECRKKARARSNRSGADCALLTVAKDNCGRAAVVKQPHTSSGAAPATILVTRLTRSFADSLKPPLRWVLDVFVQGISSHTATDSLRIRQVSNGDVLKS